MTTTTMNGSSRIARKCRQIVKGFMVRFEVPSWRLRVSNFYIT